MFIAPVLFAVTIVPIELGLPSEACANTKVVAAARRPSWRAEAARPTTNQGRACDVKSGQTAVEKRDEGAARGRILPR